MFNLLLKTSALFVWSILAGIFVAFYLDTHGLSTDFKLADLSILRKKLVSPVASKKGVIVVRKIKDNWVYDVKNKKVLFAEDDFVSNRSDHLNAVLKSPLKKDQYLYIKGKLAELQLPIELALIPIIESEYNSDAVSPRGAGGLWQLMPKTAGDLGLSDGDRFLLEPSTNAALVYFKQLHKKFGNWEFAIAAYNAGCGKVEKALSKKPTAKSIKELNLPVETKDYVSKFYKIITLSKND